MKHARYLCLMMVFFSYSFFSGCQTPSSHEIQAETDNDSATSLSQSDLENTFEQPRHLALLLPLTGKHADSAKAIRAGFLASYYQTPAHATKPTVRVYDTTSYKDIQAVYELALQEGADLVIGPLAKEDVYRLSLLSMSTLKAPVLALNTHPQARSSKKLFQFALTPEAEAQQIAEKAWQRGLRNACIIVPNNEWGKRIAQGFTQRWERQGGHIRATVYAPASQQDQSAAVRRLLGVEESQKRANEIKNLLTEKMTFEPKRRQDIDVIFMAAPPIQARQLKPLFDFYYAENVPVYATSSVYSGTPSPQEDHDLNGVIFCDMPWLLDPNTKRDVNALLNQHAPSASNEYKRLFALGLDAYQLTGRLAQLQTHRAYYQGATGQLFMDNHQLIQRQLFCAKIANGLPVPLQP